MEPRASLGKVSVHLYLGIPTVVCHQITIHIHTFAALTQFLPSSPSKLSNLYIPPVYKSPFTGSTVHFSCFPISFFSNGVTT